jgi:hypothetical protein
MGELFSAPGPVKAVLLLAWPRVRQSMNSQRVDDFLAAPGGLLTPGGFTSLGPVNAQRGLLVLVNAHTGKNL